MIKHICTHPQTWKRNRTGKTHRWKEETCFNETYHCCMTQYDHSVWPASKDESWARMHNALTWPHTHTYTQACTHSDSLRTRIMQPSLRSWKVLAKDFLPGTWSSHSEDNNNNNCSSYIKRITKTTKTLQSLKHHVVTSKFLSSNSSITITSTTNDNTTSVNEGQLEIT